MEENVVSIAPEEDQPPFSLKLQEVTHGHGQSLQEDDYFSSCLLVRTPKEGTAFRLKGKLVCQTRAHIPEHERELFCSSRQPNKHYVSTSGKNQIVKSSFSPRKSPLKMRRGSAITHMSHNLINQAKHIVKQKPAVQAFNYTSPNRIHWQSESPKRIDQYAHAWGLTQHIKPTFCVDLQPKDITATSCCTILADTKQVLFEMQGTRKKEVASLTKIMTAYTVVAICHMYGIKIREHKIMVHKQASFMEGTSANLRSDEELLIIDLLYGLLLPSGNDAGVALAQYFGKFLSFKFVKDNSIAVNGGDSIQKFTENIKYYDQQYQHDSIKLFVFEMNKNSQKLCMKDTHFVNPTGLSNVNNVSTARDIALLTQACLKNAVLRSIFKKKSYNCIASNDKMGYTRQIHWKNTNKHLFQIRECIGVKTGITPTAGPCLCSAYRIGTRQVIVVVLNCLSIEQRYNDALVLYKQCRKRLATY